MGSIGVAAGLLAASGVARADLSDFQEFTYDDGQGHTLPYRLYVPQDYDPARSYPVVIHLHGSYEAGTDNLKPAEHISSQDLLAHVKDPQYSSFLLVPQAPSNKSWNSYSAGDPMPLTMNVLGQLESQYNVDSKRVYLTGLSLGGIGTWYSAAHYQNTFAAAVPVAGWGNNDFTALKDTPIWAFQGGADQNVNPVYSRTMVNGIKTVGGHPLYTEYYGADHSDTTWNRVYSESGLYTWMFNQSLDGPLTTPPSPPPADSSRSFNESFSTSTLNGQLHDVSNNYIVSAGQLKHTATNGDRTYVTTTQADLNEHDFHFGVTINSDQGGGGNGIAFVGFGPAVPNSGNFGEPSSSLYVRLMPPDFIGKADLTVQGAGVADFGAYGGGQHRVEIIKEGDLLTFNLDRDYNGEVFFTDSTYTIDLSTLSGLDSTHSRLFFGTASNAIAFDDVVLRVTAVPEPVSLLLLASPWLLLRRRRMQRFNSTAQATPDAGR
jgi:poly(3-hydroxybutyrate) depolymerase